jgi:carbamoyltransferase
LVAVDEMARRVHGRAEYLRYLENPESNMSASIKRVLGISGYYHDASAALVADGEVVAAASEERFTRLKHDSNFPHFSINFCLGRAGITPDQLDAVVFYEDPYLKFTRVVASTLAGFPHSRRPFVGAIKEWVRKKLWLQSQISSELGVHPGKIRFAAHHHSHLAQAFLASPFDEAAIVTIDAVGEWTCTSIGRGSRGDDRAVIPLESVSYPHSLGLAYAAFSAFLGFRPNDGEASTMALAAFGRPTYVDEVRRVIRIDRDGTYKLNHRMFDFLCSGDGLFGKDFIRVFGRPRDHRSELPFDSLSDDFLTGRVSEDHRRFADIAASVQQVLEEAVLALADRAWRLTKSKNLCLAGGVALNAVANSRVIEQSHFQDVFIPPDPGDGGAALGAALLEYCRLSGDCPPMKLAPWLGQSYAGDGLGRMLECSAEGEACHKVHGGPDPGAVSSESFDSFDDLIEEVADDLEAGLIVGWFQGRFELGPRALGNRSILADPSNLPCVRRLSGRVKKRARFRPYALAIREEDVAIGFDFDGPIPRCARWMQMVKPVRPEVEPLVRGAIHVDHTTRLQVCSSGDNPRFHQLLCAFGRRRGLGALLNTSFNEAGYPMLASPVEALLVFARTDMDVLVINNLVIRRARHGSQYTIRATGDHLAVGGLARSEVDF